LTWGAADLNLVTKRGAFFYQFEKFTKFSGLAHGIFTREAGYSKGSFQGLNISYGLGDDNRKVQKNRNVLTRCMDGNQLVFVRQVHGDEVVIVDGRWCANPNDETPAPPIGDALVTNLRRRLLVVQVADCQAVLLYDHSRAVVANVHAGWRGSVNAIIDRTLDVMIEQYGCRPRDIVAGIGPSLGPCCAEFVNYKLEIPEKYWSYKNAAHHFDFWAISRDQLSQAGLLSENISIGGICTKCNTDRFYSYRGEGITGRFAAVIGLM
jgi:YfiH family protein